jgi:hypothetical protein
MSWSTTYRPRSRRNRGVIDAEQPVPARKHPGAIPRRTLEHNRLAYGISHSAQRGDEAISGIAQQDW